MSQYTLFERIGALSGYSHPGYADSLSEFGAPHILPRSGGWILQRQVPGFSYRDAIGCYPLFTCQDWALLHSDLENIGSELVSLSVVTDPFGDYDSNRLRQCFRDVVVPFKEHFIVDLSRPMDTFVHPHHRRYSQRALRDVRTERCQDPSQFIKEWVDLYTVLIQRHSIKGIPAFSRLSFHKQMAVPGMVMFRAVHKATTIGITLWYVQEDVGYYHLGAYSDSGYELRASFALFWFAIEYFMASKLRWLNLGAGAGYKGSGTDGLTRFKSGWSTGTRTAYFCGRIFNPIKYSEIVTARGLSRTDYFPAYRKGEFE